MAISSYLSPKKRYWLIRIVSVITSSVGVFLIAFGTLVIFACVVESAKAQRPAAAAKVKAASTPQLSWQDLPQHTEAANSGTSDTGWLFAMVIVTGCYSWGLVFVGVGGVLRLMVHVEENTRASAQFLSSLRAPGDAAPAAFVDPLQGLTLTA